METAAGTPMAEPTRALDRHVLTGGGASLHATKPVERGAYPSMIDSLENPDQVVKTVLSRAKYAAEYRRAFEEEWHRSFLAMFQVFSSAIESSWISQRYMPLILSNVETAHSIIGSVVADAGKICGFRGKSPEGRDCARAHEELLDSQNRGKVKIARKIFDAEWWALVTGTAIVDTGWEFEEGVRTVAVVEDSPADGKVKTMKQKPVVIKDRPFVKELNPLDVYLCPHSGKGKDHEWVVIRARCSLGEVRAAAGKGHIDKARFDKWEKESNPTDGKIGNKTGFDSYLGSKLLDIWLNEVGKSNAQDQKGDDEDGAKDDKMVELLIYRSRTEIITLADDKTMLGYSLNPHKHGEVGIVTNVYIEIKGCPYGRGLAGILLGHQELLNANVNLFADVMFVSMMRPMVVDRSLISILDDEAIFEPNAMLRARMNAREAIVPLEIPAPTNLFIMWDSHLKKDADDTGGFTEQARGMASTNTPTATEFTGTQANIQNRLKKHVLNIKWFVEDVCSLVGELNEQYMTQEEVISVLGEDGFGWRTIKPWELVGEVICYATTSPKYANPDLHVQRQLQILQVLLPLLQQGQMNPAVVKLLRGILRAANTDDLDQILPAGMETVKSWRSENEYILRGGKPKPTIAEVRSGASSEHIAGHALFRQELEADPTIPPEVIAALDEHIQQHMVLEQQFGQAAAMLSAGGGAAPGQQPAGGDPGREQATNMGQAMGGGGIPGRASPGPAAPMGRPMGA